MLNGRRLTQEVVDLQVLPAVQQREARAVEVLEPKDDSPQSPGSPRALSPSAAAFSASNGGASATAGTPTKRRASMIYTPRVKAVLQRRRDWEDAVIADPDGVGSPRVGSPLGVPGAFSPAPSPGRADCMGPPGLGIETDWTPTFVGECSLPPNQNYDDDRVVVITDTNVHVTGPKTAGKLAKIEITIPLDRIVGIEEAFNHLAISYYELKRIDPPGKKIPKRHFSLAHTNMHEDMAPAGGVEKIFDNKHHPAWEKTTYVDKRDVKLYSILEIETVDDGLQARIHSPVARERMQELCRRYEMVVRIFSLGEWNRAIKTTFWKSLKLYKYLIDEVERCYLVVQKYVKQLTTQKRRQSAAQIAALVGLKNIPVERREPRISDLECIINVRYLRRCLRLLTSMFFDTDQVKERLHVFAMLSPYGFMDLVKIVLAGSKLVEYFERKAHVAISQYSVPALSVPISTHEQLAEKHAHIVCAADKAVGEAKPEEEFKPRGHYTRAKKRAAEITAPYNDALHPMRVAIAANKNKIRDLTPTLSKDVVDVKDADEASQNEDARRRRHQSYHPLHNGFCKPPIHRPYHKMIHDALPRNRPPNEKHHQTPFHTPPDQGRNLSVSFAADTRVIIHDSALEQLMSGPIATNPKVQYATAKAEWDRSGVRPQRGNSMLAMMALPDMDRIDLWDDRWAYPGSYSALFPWKKFKHRSRTGGIAVIEVSAEDLRAPLGPVNEPPVTRAIEPVESDTDSVASSSYSRAPSTISCRTIPDPPRPRGRFRTNYPTQPCFSTPTSPLHGALRRAALDGHMLLHELLQFSKREAEAHAHLNAHLLKNLNPSLLVQLLATALHGDIHPDDVDEMRAGKNSSRQARPPPGVMVSCYRAVLLLEHYVEVGKYLQAHNGVADGKRKGAMEAHEEEWAYLFANERKVGMALDGDSRQIAACIRAGLGRFVEEFGHVKRSQFKQFEATLRRMPTPRLRLSYNVHSPPSVSPFHPPLLILHGLFGSKQNWRSLSRALANRLATRVIALDLRNHGDSPHDDVHTFDAMCGDLDGVIEQVQGQEGERVDLLGHSMGGNTAMHYALTRPGRVNKLVVVDKAPIPHKLSSEFGDYDLSIRQFLLTNLKESKTSPGHWKFRVNLDVLGKALDSDIAGFPLASSPGATPTFSNPTLFLRGTQSNYIPRGCEGTIRKLFPKAEVVDIDAGHWSLGGGGSVASASGTQASVQGDIGDDLLFRRFAY
ncbi:hypothetical protein HK101_007068 [Irineochytrium annulatum]|nr:hypothetical protein HK101_007068 [Irineochytrium annulatum]